jgi:hypothetical protein
MVRFHSRAIQGGEAIVRFIDSAASATEDDMATTRINPDLLSADGDILVFAPPILIGFRGAPLALADSLPKRRLKGGSKKNWAKRRAYGA